MSTKFHLMLKVHLVFFTSKLTKKNPIGGQSWIVFSWGRQNFRREQVSRRRTILLKGWRQISLHYVQSWTFYRFYLLNTKIVSTHLEHSINPFPSIQQLDTTTSHTNRSLTTNKRPKRINDIHFLYAILPISTSIHHFISRRLPNKNETIPTCAADPQTVRPQLKPYN